MEKIYAGNFFVAGIFFCGSSKNPAKSDKLEPLKNLVLHGMLTQERI